MGEAPELTLLVPCFNEADTIVRCLDALTAWTHQQDYDIETLVVDDGSTDDTRQLVSRHANVRCVSAASDGSNVGKGAALRTGVESATGRYVVFLDADLAVGPAFVTPMVAQLRDGADVVAGCRTIAGAVIKRRQPWRRRVLGRAYLKLARRMLRLGPRDVTCGFKGFKRIVAQDLFGRTRARRWGLDAEILYLARRLALDVREVPVTWVDGGVSRVRLWRDVPVSLLSLIATGWRHRSVRP